MNSNNSNAINNSNSNDINNNSNSNDINNNSNNNSRRSRRHNRRSISNYNFYPNGHTPINNRGQAEEARRLRDVSPSGDNDRSYVGFPRLAARPGFDNLGVFWGPYLHVFRNTIVPGQTRTERKRMACIMRKHGLMDKQEYRSIKSFLESLKHLPQRDDLLFYMDSRVFSFLVKGWILDSTSETFDFLGVQRIFNEITDKLGGLSYMTAPHRVSKYGRDLLG